MGVYLITGGAGFFGSILKKKLLWAIGFPNSERDESNDKKPQEFLPGAGDLHFISRCYRQS